MASSKNKSAKKKTSKKNVEQDNAQQKITKTKKSAEAPVENKLVAERRAKLDAIREKGNAFPNGFRRTDETIELINYLSEKSKEYLEQIDR